MPVITVPALREAAINVVVSSPRPEGIPSTIIPNADKHDEIASTVEAALDEYYHITENETWVSSALQLKTYFALKGATDFYAVRALRPAGSIVEVDENFMLDVLRIRFSLVFAVLDPSLRADARTGKAFNRHFQAAIKGLFITGWSQNDVFIPGDKDRRPGDRTEIDVTLEMGGYQGVKPFEKAP